MRLNIDFETRSTVDLRRAGVHRYARDPSTDIWCMAWAFDDEDVGIFIPLEGVIRMGGAVHWPRLWAHIQSGGEVRAWNAQFERVIWNEILVKRHGFPPLTIEQVVDTAAEAAAMALPRGLGYCAEVLNVDQEKDDDGRRLMLQMSKPRKPRKGEDPDAILWWDDEDRKQRLYDYCEQDVRTERAVAARLRRLNPTETRIYQLDQRVNDRGVRIDLPLVRAAEHIVQRGTELANNELRDLTGGEVDGVTRVADLKRWLAGRGVEVDSLSKNIVRDLLGDETPQLDADVERALTLRTETGKSSTAKLRAMTDATCDDERARGLLLYHGASTGRWAGKLIQPQNFPRPLLKDVEEFIPMVMAGEYEAIDAKHPPVMVVSDLLRSMIVASPGQVLRSGDFAQIEARVLAWIAGQEDLLELFASGGRVYEDMAAYIFGVPIEEIRNPSEERQVGKNTVLGCGFGMGPDRYREQAQEQTGIDIGEELAVRAVGAYREKNDKIKRFWSDIEDAAVAAVVKPGSVHAVGRRDGIRFTFRGQFLWCQLPSGRFLAYAKPELRRRTIKRKDDSTWETTSLSYMGVDSYTRKWKRQWTYGGHLTENVVQAMARDLMASAMLRLEDRGYPVVLTVHDEVLCDCPEDVGTQEDFLATMSARPQWAFDVPVKVEGWAGERYRK